jgi:hypothetical protein
MNIDESKFDFGFTRGGNSVANPKCDVLVTVNQSGRKDDHSGCQIRVRIASRLMDDLRWKPGDYVQFGMSEDALLIRRVTPQFTGPRYKLTPTDNKGKNQSVTVKRTRPSWFCMKKGDVLEFATVLPVDGDLLMNINDGELTRSEGAA